jgi:hypothetical protein
MERIYHITHVANLASIVADDCLWSDYDMLAQGKVARSIGLSAIKQRRLALPLKCHPGDTVGQYVPFNFCPRSVMLYILHRGNLPDLQFRDGQAMIVHLEMDMQAVVDWCEATDTRWAFSLSNAGAVYTEFRARINQLSEVNAAAVAARDFRDPQILEAKQAEFLVQRRVPWSLVRRVGSGSREALQLAQRALVGKVHRPPVEIVPEWYF